MWYLEHVALCLALNLSIFRSVDTQPILNKLLFFNFDKHLFRLNISVYLNSCLKFYMCVAVGLKIFFSVVNYLPANKRSFKSVSIVFRHLSTIRINSKIFEMHAMKIFWCCVSLSLPLIICGQEALSNVLAKMNEISRRGEFINGVIKPSIEGYIGKGIVSFTYRGRIFEKN